MRRRNSIEALLADTQAALADNQAHEVRTPTLISPPESKTPPTITSNRHATGADNATAGMKNARRSLAASGDKDRPVDPLALSKALEKYDEAKKEKQRERELTPGLSPSRKRLRSGGYGDRFIPNRANQDLHAGFSLLHEEGSPATPRSRRSKNMNTESGEVDLQKTEEANRTFSALLRGEMFNDEIPQSFDFSTTSYNNFDHSTRSHDPSRAKTPPVNAIPPPQLTPSTPHKNLFTFKAANQGVPTPRSQSRSYGSTPVNFNMRSEVYSLSPIKLSAQNMLLSPRKAPRQVSKVPYKVLDAPDLADDFYLNLVDWGSQNVLAVGLGGCVYLWDGGTGNVSKLVDLGNVGVTSVGWIQRGTHLAIGTSNGQLLLYDAVQRRRLRTMTGHTSRLSSLSWNSHILSTGSRDRSILHRDVRDPAQWVKKLQGHRQEVCGLRWDSETGRLASGGNDNRVFLWNNLDTEPIARWGPGGEGLGGHRAAVKALAWSPHQRGLLATGGGTADRTIKFWNTLLNPHAPTSLNSAGGAVLPTSFNPGISGLHEEILDNPTLGMNNANTPEALLYSHDTGSQVCNLLWSLNTNELVSTHGYSQNQIVVWKYRGGSSLNSSTRANTVQDHNSLSGNCPLQQVVSLTGHTYRVLYLAMSPDGQVVVTGAGDETLRFWRVFGKKERVGGLMGMESKYGVIR